MIPLGMLGAARVRPAQLVSDTFTRADNELTLGNAETGEPWEIFGGTWGIAGGCAYRSLGGHNLRAHAVINYSTPDMRVAATLAAVGGSAEYPSLVARFVDVSNLYVFTVGSGVSLVRRSADVNVTLVNIGGSYAPGDVVALQCEEVGGGTVLRIFRNGAQVGTYTDTAAGRPAGTRGGLFAYHSGTPATRWDNFTITNPEA